MKSYTDLEQSRMLAEILPIESADGYWFKGFPCQPYMVYTKGTPNPGEHIPCWSLGALFELFDDKAGLARDYGWWFCYDNGKSHCTKHYENSIDAAFEMVVWLKENKKI